MPSSTLAPWRPYFGSAPSAVASDTGAPTAAAPVGELSAPPGRSSGRRRGLATNCPRATPAASARPTASAIVIVTNPSDGPSIASW